MFGDTITVGGATLTKINQDNFGSTYRVADSTSETLVNIRHSSRKDTSRGGIRVDRHNIEHIARAYGTSGNPDLIRKVYYVIECDYNDVPATEILFGAMLPTYLIASTNAALTKLVNRES
jgi:cAMP phosphodiesterase